MPAGASYSLDSVTLRLLVETDSIPGLALDIYANSSGAPTGSALVTFPTPSFAAGSTADYTLVPTTSFTLLPSTTYWLVASPQAPRANLDWAAALGVTSSGIASSAGFYQAASFGGSNVIGEVGLFYQVDGTPLDEGAVPEPGTFALLGAGLLALWIRQRGLFSA
jgi:hypothetical protein